MSFEICKYSVHVGVDYAAGFQVRSEETCIKEMCSFFVCFLSGLNTFMLQMQLDGGWGENAFNIAIMNTDILL